MISELFLSRVFGVAAVKEEGKSFKYYTLMSVIHEIAIIALALMVVIILSKR